MGNLLKGMILDGVFASEAVDTSGEILDVRGCDISELEEGRGIVNYEHSNNSPEDVLGKIVYAKKIFGPKDCDDPRQLAYWKKLQLPLIYGRVELFDSEDHPSAKATAAIVRYYHSHKEPLLSRWSIEGTTMEREGNTLKRSVAKNVALTLKPCNRSCSSGLIEEAHVVSDGVKKAEADAGRLLRKGEFGECTGAISDPMGETVGARLLAALDGLRELADLAKTITAGGMDAAPGSLTQGSALQAEHVERRGQVLSALRDWDRHTPIRTFLKNRLPQASEDYIGLFAGLVDDFEMKKAEGLFDALHGALSKGIGKGKVVAESVPAQKMRTFASVGGSKIEGTIADAGHGDRIRGELAGKGHADLVLYRGIGRKGGRKYGPRVLPTAMSSDVRYYTLSRPQAETVAHWKSGHVTGETRKYGARVRNPLVVEGYDEEKALWKRVGDHIAAKHGYHHDSAWAGAHGGSIVANRDRLSPNHVEKKGKPTDSNPALRRGVGVDWHTHSSSPKNVSAPVKQFLGEYLRDHGHDAGVFLPRKNENGVLQVPSDGMSQVVIPHEQGYWPDADDQGGEQDWFGKAEALAAPLQERGTPKKYFLSEEHGAEGHRRALDDGDYILWHRDGERERPLFRFLSRGGAVTHLEDHTGGSLSCAVPEGPMTHQTHAALQGVMEEHPGLALEKAGAEDSGEPGLVPAAPEDEGEGVPYEVDLGDGPRQFRLVGDRLVDEDGEPLSEAETEEMLAAIASGSAEAREMGADTQGVESPGAGTESNK